MGVGVEVGLGVDVGVGSVVGAGIAAAGGVDSPTGPPPQATAGKSNNVSSRPKAANGNTGFSDFTGNSDYNNFRDTLNKSVTWAFIPS